MVAGAHPRAPGFTGHEMLPTVDKLATVVVCDDDEPTRELLCDHLTRRPLPGAAGAERLRRAAALRFQPSRT